MFTHKNILFLEFKRKIEIVALPMFLITLNITTLYL